ncbi:glycosyltransferase, partial [Herbaspirillum sp. C7C2]
MEAMSQGCPAIVSRIAGVTDMIVTDGEDGMLFPIGDCGRAAAQIDRLAGDPQLRNRMAEAAVQKVTSTFDSDIVGGAYVNLLQKLH